MRSSHLLIPSILLLCSLLAGPAAAQTPDEVLHVDQQHPAASDENPGTSAQPLLTIQEAMDRARAHKKNYRSVKVLIGPGVYREAVEFAYTNHPNNQPGNNTPVTVEGAGPEQTIISGADRFENWREEGQGYSHAWPYDWGLSKDLHNGRVPIPEPELVLRREMVFTRGNGSPGGERLRQVLSAGEMEPGTFRVDEGADRIYAWPSGGVDLAEQGAEVAVRSRGWYTQYENNFTLRGLSVQHVATPWTYGEGAIVINSAERVTIEDVVARQNNFMGFSLQLDADVRLLRSKALANGNSGWTPRKLTDFEVEEVELSYNNWRGALGGLTSWGPGNKSMSVHGMTVRGLKAIGNHSRGLWLDGDHKDVVLEDVELRGNLNDGLFLEVSQGPIELRNAKISENQGYAIRSGDAENVTITDAELTGNQRGEFHISGANGGRVFTDFETGERFHVKTRNWTFTGNTVAGVSEHLFSTTYGRDDWAEFINTLTSDRNTWRHSNRRDVFGWHKQQGLLSLTLEEWQDRTGRDGNSTFEVSVDGDSSGDGDIVFAVNAGGEAFTTPGGQTYQADTGYEGGLPYATDASIRSTDDDALYQSERYGNFSYTVPLEDGRYEVVLHFAEIYHESRDERLFDVEIENEEVVADIDLYARAGANAAYDLRYTMEVTDGALNVIFETDRDNAKLSALLVRRTTGGGGETSAAKTLAAGETAVAKAAKATAPTELALQDNHPNPFSQSTTIRFELPERQRVQLSVYDLLGRKVATLVDGVVAAGVHQVRWGAEGLPSGTYFYRMEAPDGGGFLKTGRMVLVR